MDREKPPAPLRKVGVSDEKLLRREFYNPNDFDVIFTIDQSRLDYVRLSGITPGPAQVICKARSWVILNHGFYCPSTKQGHRAIELVENRGALIGVGNKLPSRAGWE